MAKTTNTTGKQYQVKTGFKKLRIDEQEPIGSVKLSEATPEQLEALVKRNSFYLRYIEEVQGDSKE